MQTFILKNTLLLFTSSFILFSNAMAYGINEQDNSRENKDNSGYSSDGDSVMKPGTMVRPELGVIQKKGTTPQYAPTQTIEYTTGNCPTNFVTNNGNASFKIQQRLTTYFYFDGQLKRTITSSWDAVNESCFYTEQKDSACPDSQSGTITEERVASYNSYGYSYEPWKKTADTCKTMVLTPPPKNSNNIDDEIDLSGLPDGVYGVASKVYDNPLAMLTFHPNGTWDTQKWKNTTTYSPDGNAQFAGDYYTEAQGRFLKAGVNPADFEIQFSDPQMWFGGRKGGDNGGQSMGGYRFLSCFYGFIPVVERCGQAPWKMDMMVFTDGQVSDNGGDLNMVKDYVLKFVITIRKISDHSVYKSVPMTISSVYQAPPDYNN